MSIFLLERSLDMFLLIFIFRFVDISVDVRVECIKRCKEFLKNHPDLVTDISGEFENILETSFCDHCVHPTSTL